MRRFLVLLFISVLSVNFAFSQPYRYVKRVFDSVVIDSGVYANAPQVNAPYNNEGNTTNVDLWYDIYMPFGDTLTLRPLIIFVHGGGFIEGNRHHEDMVAFCDTFAHAGYVTATIDYRQGMYVLDQDFTPISGARAVYRGLQDMRSAIRYFRANWQTFGIDTNNIYVVGSSAGAFMALHDLFMTKPEERPAETYDTTYHNPLDNPLDPSDDTYTAPDLGGYDVGDNLAHDGRANLIVALWGALGDTAFIQEDELRPTFLVHGTYDSIVFFQYGHPFNISYLPATYGSYLINQKFDQLGFEQKQTYFVEGVGHEFYGATNGDFNCDTCPNQYWDTIVCKIKNFMWNYHKPTVSFTYTESLGDPFTYEFDANLSTDVVGFYWLFDNDTVVGELSPSYTFSSDGLHTVILYAYNQLLSWDTAKAIIDIQVAANVGRLNQKIRLYPNPVAQKLVVSLPDERTYNIEILDLTGRKLKQFKARSTIELDVSDLANGTYLLRVYNPESSFVRKFTVKR